MCSLWNPNREGQGNGFWPFDGSHTDPCAVACLIVVQNALSAENALQTARLPEPLKTCRSEALKATFLVWCATIETQICQWHLEPEILHIHVIYILQRTKCSGEDALRGTVREVERVAEDSGPGVLCTRSGGRTRTQSPHGVWTVRLGKTKKKMFSFANLGKRKVVVKKGDNTWCCFESRKGFDLICCIREGNSRTKSFILSYSRRSRVSNTYKDRDMYEVSKGEAGKMFVYSTMQTVRKVLFLFQFSVGHFGVSQIKFCCGISKECFCLKINKLVPHLWTDSDVLHFHFVFFALVSDSVSVLFLCGVDYVPSKRVRSHQSGTQQV